ncbi:unnamed protein product, partial [Cyprideis torosa]
DLTEIFSQTSSKKGDGESDVVSRQTGEVSTATAKGPEGSKATSRKIMSGKTIGSKIPSNKLFSSKARKKTRKGLAEKSQKPEQSKALERSKLE